MRFQLVAVLSFCLFATASAADEPNVRFRVTVNRGEDLGQNFGSLFEASSADGSVVIGAGFQNGYNTRYRADRHAIQFFIRPTGGKRTFETSALPRPNELCGTYLYARDGIVHSTYGGAASWNPDTEKWEKSAPIGGTEETMRVGDGQLEFGNSRVKYKGQTILGPPEVGSYQLFFYANGYLCFYHVNRQDKPYRFFENEADGFSKLYACPWKPGNSPVDLSKATILTLPVVGETTFAWGQFDGQIVTGSNIGGFYIFENRTWRMLLEPKLTTSYQLYSIMSFRDHLLMGQYPTGRVFAFDGKEISDNPGWPPKLDGVSGSSREAQTTVIYGGDVFVGVWPWGEVWRYNPDSKSWAFMQRMFDHPEPSDKIIHPYDVENKGNSVGNQWGQRVTSLVTRGSDLFISTSAKWPCEWDEETFPFLANNKWQSYGRVYRMTMPGHLGAPTKWTNGPTTFEFSIRGTDVSITQDGRELTSTKLTGELAKSVSAIAKLKQPKWGNGIYGKFSGPSIDGTVVAE